VVFRGDLSAARRLLKIHSAPQAHKPPKVG
jgi:hypothetical protein